MATPKPFDPKDPSTWPKLNPKQLAEMQAKAGYKPLTGKKPTGTPVQPDTNMYNAGLGDVLRGAGNAFVKAGDFLIKEPAKSIGRTLSTQNIQTALNPRSTATQRINAVGEDAMNVASFLPGARAGLNFADNALQNLALRKSIRNASVPEIYDYGIHISENPKIKNFINSAGRENTSGYADDALEGSSYHWTLTPERAYPGEISFDQIADEGAWNAKNWTNNRDSTAYLTRFPMSKSYPDENFLDQYGGFEDGEFDDLFSFIPSTRTEVPMEILDSKRLLLPNQSALGEKNAILEMINRNKRQIALNNKRNQYKNFGTDLKYGDPRYNDVFRQQTELSSLRRQRIGGLQPHALVIMCGDRRTHDNHHQTV